MTTISKIIAVSCYYFQFCAKAAESGGDGKGGYPMSGCTPKSTPAVVPADLSSIHPNKEGTMRLIEGVMYQTNAP
ncbi:MAG: hypothetical protein KUA35_06515, partial [Pseudodesulfovibrio sp.]|uniref:hypothetical protein n=1 Tax=Pseudodesulfovibrio sp. TaxID=2035812 RepID=UPI001D74B73E